MGDILEVDKLILFLLFFIPGFISLKIYKLIIASEKIDFANSVFEAVAFSSLNYAFFSWLILIISKPDFINNHFIFFIVFVVIILFFAPMVWPFVVVWLMNRRWFRKYILSPFKSPWDFYFSKKQSCWVIVYFKDGTKIGGVYSTNSFASSYPHGEQIYLEEVWEIRGERDFSRKLDSTKGAMILSEEIKFLEFYK